MHETVSAYVPQTLADEMRVLYLRGVEDGLVTGMAAVHADTQPGPAAVTVASVAMDYGLDPAEVIQRVIDLLSRRENSTGLARRAAGRREAGRERQSSWRRA
jgi:hypothetical protein